MLGLVDCQFEKYEARAIGCVSTENGGGIKTEGDKKQKLWFANKLISKFAGVMVVGVEVYCSIKADRILISTI